jgi:hypothetical protein
MGSVAGRVQGEPRAPDEGYAVDGPARFVAEVSGHSMRVGGPQDLAELDTDLAAITQAGGWKSTRTPLQYAEKISAARSGMARAAAATGRDESVAEEGKGALSQGFQESYSQANADAGENRDSSLKQDCLIMEESGNSAPES